MKTMKRNWLVPVCCLLAVIFTASCALAFDANEGSAPEEAFRLYEDKGEVISVAADGDGARIVAKGFYGYHPDENPSVTIGADIDVDGVVKDIVILDHEGQTPGFTEMITEAFLADAYVGLNLSTAAQADVVTGATMTSGAVNYGVRAALYYAANELGLGGSDIASIEAFAAFYPGDYVAITTDYAPDAKTYGSVLLAAEDDDTVVLKVESSKKLNYKKSSDTGWPNAEPTPFTMLIAIDKATDSVAAWEIVVDGTRRTEYFTVPPEAIDAYKGVAIADETVFDSFTDGLVFELDVELSKDDMGMSIITGTSIIYTGASIDGTFSSQLVRRCFQTAARFYANYAE